MNPTTAILLAGGKGVRFRAGRTDRDAIKVMLPVNDRPVLEWNLKILRDQMNIRSVIMIVGSHKEVIQEYFGDGRNFGLEISYLESNPDSDLPTALLLAKDSVSGPFVLMLGDEFYLNAGHDRIDMAEFPSDMEALVTFARSNNPQEIEKNYTVHIDDNMRVAKLVEKPDHLETNCMGLGTFIFRESIFDYLLDGASNPRTGRRELIDAISNMAADKPVYAFELGKEYVNINTVEDRYFAEYLFRSHIFPSIKKSLVIPCYNEAESLSFVLNDFQESVDEIIVADGGSTDGSVAIVEAFQQSCPKDVKLVQAKFAGYGDAIRNGVKAASGEVVVIVEADATFRSRDIHKIFEYLQDSDMVIGTRTTRQLICQGANMLGWLRLGNVFAAKLVELLWWFRGEPRFTDVGCTFRAFWKSAYDEIEHNFVGLGPEFSPEMMVEFVRNNKRVIEIPVSYFPRVGGDSKHSQSFFGIMKTAMRMLTLILKKRFNLYPEPARQPNDAVRKTSDIVEAE